MSASVQHKVLIHTARSSSSDSIANELPQLGELLRAGWRVVTMHSAAHAHAVVAMAGPEGAVVLLERPIA